MESGFSRATSRSIASHIVFAFAFLWIAPAAQAAPIQWTVASGGNGHWYEMVALIPGQGWETSRDTALTLSFMGLSGYLGTVTSSGENQFIFDNFSGLFDAGSNFFDDPIGDGNDKFVWLSGNDKPDGGVEGKWIWGSGPEAGVQFWQGDSTGTTTAPFNYANWGTGQPSCDPDVPPCAGPNQDFLAMNMGPEFSGTGPGEWIDIEIFGNGLVPAYIVEYGTSISSVVPIPAASWLFLSALGLLGMARRSSK